MRLSKITWRHFLVYSSKAVILVTLLVAMFSPFGKWSVPLSYAGTCQPLNPSAGVTTGVNSASECPRGTYFADDQGKEILGTDNKLQFGGQESCNSFASCIANVVYLFTVGLGGAVAYVGAWMLSLTIALTLQSTAYALGFLSGAWEVIRDIANLCFILILVYIAFVIMLRAETADTMKRLAWVVVMALLINFSFFFTRVVIDAGNLLAVQFYNAIDGPTIGATAAQTNLQGVVTSAAYAGIGANETKDLTASIMDGIGIQKILNTESFKKFQEDSDWFTELIALCFIYIAVGAMFFMLAAAFFAVAVKFLMRTVVLWFAIIFSPLALVANILEKTKKGFHFWLTTLFTHAFYPAVFLLLFYLLTLLMQELRGGNTTADTIIGRAFGDVTTLSSSGLNYMVAVVAILAVYLGFVLIMLYLSLKASDLMNVWAKESSAGFARFATRMGSNLGYRGAAFVGRQTIGRGAAALADSSRIRQLTGAGRILSRPGSNLLDRTLGRVMQAPRGVLQGIGAGTFDVRNLPGAEGAKQLLKDRQYGWGEKGRINYDLGDPSKGSVNRTQQASNALRRRGGGGVPVPPQGPPPAPVPVGGPRPLTPPPLAVHATVPPESPQLVKVEKAVKELTHRIEESASATSHLTKAVEKPQLTHSNSTSPALEDRLKGVEEALLSRSASSSAPKQITYQPGQTMPIDIELTKEKDGSFSFKPDSKS